LTKARYIAAEGINGIHHNSDCCLDAGATHQSCCDVLPSVCCDFSFEAYYITLLIIERWFQAHISMICNTMKDCHLYDFLRCPPPSHTTAQTTIYQSSESFHIRGIWNTSHSAEVTLRNLAPGSSPGKLRRSYYIP